MQKMFLFIWLAMINVATALNTKDWMFRIPDKYSTTNISMPGTHESMSRYGGETTQCQNTSLTQQFDNGIRFVDIRCRHLNDELLIFHGPVPQRATFDDVLKATTEFLAAHPKEAVFMRVSEEYTPENNTKTFAQAVQIYVDRYPIGALYKGKGYPPMSEARGKLVVLRDYGGPATFGLPYGDMDIEDQWQIEDLSKEEIQKKWNAVRGHLEKAQLGPTGTMYLTYSSGAGVFAWPDDVSERLNKMLAGYLGDSKAKWGMIAMDFPNAKLIDMIIDSNV
ncbi:1-phosphatidylinositol phosphodiesterase-like [Patiria miniata]|uniref:Phosphatidylinositol-specific phospholipase C X domain-containing protein n=1 Tax=Patiria miniata TaxID=46514 RepID=A0A913ZUJ5_PATMI|nr:1-phosphatidylinositol phosphodiesterase-like [Patiria miniata]